MKNKGKNIRLGKGFKWEGEPAALAGTTREISGFTIDNLDTKDFEDAESDYEKIFILSRIILENNSFCEEDSNSRLQCCQEIADIIRQKGILK